MATKTPMHVDKEIDKTVLLSDLRAQMNSLLPICRIPPEILENIFTLCARDYYEVDDYPFFHVPHWVYVSYVCRHWRDVALKCATLWTYHFTVSPRWTEELLARSNQASLKIRISSHYMRAASWWSDLVGRVLNHAERIQELRLDVPCVMLPTELSLNAPRLQILDINCWLYGPQQTLMINNGDSLHLRTLKLAYCPLPFRSTFNPSGVTTLSLSFVPSPSQQDIMGFLATLSRMQALTTLHLEEALPSARSLLSDRAFSVFPEVSLPRLFRLSIRDPLSTVVALLSHMNIPAKTRLRLDIKFEGDSSINDYAQLSSVLAQKLGHSVELFPSSPVIRSLVTHFHLDTTFTSGASEHGVLDPTPSAAFPPEDCELPLVVAVRKTQSSDRDCIMNGIFCSIPSTQVQYFYIAYPPISLDFWRKLLGHFDGLLHMKLSHGYMPDLASLLAFPTDGSAEDRDVDHNPTPGHIFVPALEKLELHCMIFAVGEYHFIGEAITTKSLVDALSTRKALAPKLIITRS